MTEIYMDEEDSTYPDYMYDFLRYLYIGGASCFTDENVIPLILLAEKYLVKGLVERATLYMTKRLDKLDSDHSVLWYRFALESQLEPLLSTCIRYIGQNFDTLSSEGKLRSLDAEHLLHLQAYLFTCQLRRLPDNLIKCCMCKNCH
jgi:hypothetical protein